METRIIKCNFFPLFELISLRQGWNLKYEFCRAEDMFRGKEVPVFEGSLTPQDVKQRVLGDCYFLSSLSAIAEHPNRLKRIFMNHKYQKNGCYCVSLCVMGVWEEIIIDDFFPCFRVGKRPCFSSSNSDELWVLLAEKAFAKISGGYANLFSGYDYEALYMLTGAPTTMFTFPEGTMDSIYDVLIDAFENSFVVTVATGSKANMQESLGRPVTGIIHFKF